MSSYRARAAMSSLADYFVRNKKVIISALVIFALGIVFGVIFALRAVGGEFEAVARVDTELASAKAFFIAVSGVCLGYAIVLVSGINNKTVVLICIPFAVLGYFLGKFACALVGRYDIYGVINLVLVYLPFFLCTFILMVIASCTVIYAPCSEHCEKSKFKPSFITVLKILGINAAMSFIFFVLLGTIAGGVIIVALY